MSHLDQFLSTLSTELPNVCSDKDLVNRLPNIFKNHCTLTRMRSRGQTPAYFSIEPNIYYLKEDVISWLRSRYNTKTESLADEIQMSCVR
jgi:hypothetical protein